MRLDRFWNGRLLSIPSVLLLSAAAVINRIYDIYSTCLHRYNFKAFGQRSVIGSHLDMRWPGNITVGNDVYIGRNVSIGSEVADSTCSIGDRVIIAWGVKIDFTGGVRIMQDVHISDGVEIITHSHGLNPKNQPVGTPLVIEEGVWIGINAIVLQCVTVIGKGAIVGAGAVVTKSVAPYSVVAGVPARVVKSISSSP